MTWGTKRLLREADKERILERDGYVCAYCLGEATQVDHILPWSYSFDDSDENLVSTCQVCNLIASDKVFPSLAEKRNYVLARRAGRKWQHRLRRSQPIACADCGEFYRPCVHSATVFLCERCAENARKMDPAERAFYLEELKKRQERKVA